MKRDFHGEGWWVIGPRPGRRLIHGAPSAAHGWKPNFFYVNYNQWGFSTEWRTPNLEANNGDSVLEADQEDFDTLCRPGIPTARDLLSEANLQFAGLISHSYTGAVMRPKLDNVRRSAGKRVASASGSPKLQGKRRKVAEESSGKVPEVSTSEEPARESEMPPAEATPPVFPRTLPEDAAFPRDPSGSSAHRNEMGLEDPNLAKKLVKHTLLPKDWEVTRTRCIEEISASSFSSLLRLAHDVTLMEESILGFQTYRKKLEDENLAAKAGKDKAEELRRAMEEKSIQDDAAVASLKSDLTKAQDKRDVLEARLDERNNTIQSLESSVDNLRQKVNEEHREAEEANKKTEEALERLKESAVEIELLKNQLRNAVEDYKKSPAFDKELTEAGAFSYRGGFNDGVKEVQKTYPDLDISGVELYDIGETGESEAEEEQVEERGTEEETATTDLIADA